MRINFGPKLSVDLDNKSENVTVQNFLKTSMDGKIIVKIILPALDSSFKFESYKIMPRAQNALALVNAGFLLKLTDKNIVEKATIIYGCINSTFVHAENTEKYLIGKEIFNNATLQQAFEQLSKELKPDPSGDHDPEFRKQLAISLFYKFVLSIAPENLINKRYRSGGLKFDRPVSKGTQDYETNQSLYPLSQPIPKLEALAQTTGEAQFVVDMPNLPHQLHAAFVLSKAPPNSKITKIDATKALQIPGVVAFMDKKDIPGKNTFTPKESNLPFEEELFCNDIIKYFNQPVGIIVAESNDIAESASELVEITYEKAKEKPIITIRQLLKEHATNKIVPYKRIEPKSKGNNIKTIAKGTVDLFHQYHYHMETQTCVVIPNEDGLDLYPATQWMELAQVSAATILNIPVNKINVTVRRCGGAFGGKISRSALVSGATALAAYKLKKPVKMWMSLEKNMRIMGKRYPLSSDYEIAIDDSGVIQYLNNTYYYDNGYVANEQCIFLVNEIYLAPYSTDNWFLDSYSTNTDVHPSCYIRSPGSLEGITMLESIMEHVAIEGNLDSFKLRLQNINKAKHAQLVEMMNEIKTWADIDKRSEFVSKFNEENRWRKRGLSIIPMVFPFEIFFSYGVALSVYQADGSVAISHSGTEIGQGVNTKAAQVCAYKLGIPLEKVAVKPSNTFSSPNSAPTGGSFTSETVCNAILKACDELMGRLKPVKDSLKNPTWEELIKKAFLEGINLSVNSLSGKKEPGLGPYDIYGVCAAEVEFDVLTGLHQILRVDLLEDAGKSISPEVDIGQVEGAFIMGQGYFLTEKVQMSDEGEVLSNNFFTYETPGPKDIPLDFRIRFLKNRPNPVGVLKSKAVGEPPLCLSVAVPIALRRAIASVREEADKTASKWCMFNGPSTVEQNFTNCLHNYKQYVL